MAEGASVLMRKRGASPAGDTPNSQRHTAPIRQDITPALGPLGVPGAAPSHSRARHVCGGRQHVQATGMDSPDNDAERQDRKAGPQGRGIESQGQLRALPLVHDPSRSGTQGPRRARVVRAWRWPRSRTRATVAHGRFFAVQPRRQEGTDGRQRTGARAPSQAHRARRWLAVCSSGQTGVDAWSIRSHGGGRHRLLGHGVYSFPYNALGRSVCHFICCRHH